MKIQKFIALALALTLASSGMAFGQNRDERRDDRREDRRDERRDDRRDDRRDNRQDFRQDQRQDHRWDNRGGNYPGRYGSPPPAYRGARGAGPDHAFYPGNRLPPYWRTRQYVVEDWRGHRLSAPPRGYHWVQSGGDYLLVAITTGIILQLLLGN